MDEGLSIFSLIIDADLIVQLIMLILILMSIYSWTLIMAKKKILIDAKKDIKIFNKELSVYTSLETLYLKMPKVNAQRSQMERIFASGYSEFMHEQSNPEYSSMVNAERSYRAMNTATNKEIDSLNSSLSVLAMIASSSPYIGLFGTVWGIMHSFVGLASVKQATIAIVAPGIAEALIATAFGLFAAIPATIAYNRLVSNVDEIGNKYTNFVEELFVVLQRE